MFNGCPSSDPNHESGRLSAAESPKAHPVPIDDLAPHAQAELIQYVFDENSPIEWTDDAIVRLHFILLDDCEKLADSETPLEEKLDILRWIYTDPQKDGAPFSFATCLKLFGRPSDPTQGTLDPREIREGFRHSLLGWIQESLDRYPTWVREAFYSNPDHMSALLEKNPQYINEEVRKRSAQGDLFAEGLTTTSTPSEVHP